MVESTCAYGEHVHEIAPFHWEFTTDSSGAYTITDRGDIPEWVDLTRIFPTIDLVYTHFDENCVARWCDACVEHEALDHGDGLSMADAQTRLTVPTPSNISLGPATFPISRYLIYLTE